MKKLWAEAGVLRHELGHRLNETVNDNFYTLGLYGLAFLGRAQSQIRRGR